MKYFLQNSKFNRLIIRKFGAKKFPLLSKPPIYDPENVRLDFSSWEEIRKRVQRWRG